MLTITSDSNNKLPFVEYWYSKPKQANVVTMNGSENEAGIQISHKQAQSQPLQ
jgi:hypothetical protein